MGCLGLEIVLLHNTFSFDGIKCNAIKLFKDKNILKPSLELNY